MIHTSMPRGQYISPLLFRQTHSQTNQKKGKTEPCQPNFPYSISPIYSSPLYPPYPQRFSYSTTPKISQNPPLFESCWLWATATPVLGSGQMAVGGCGTRLLNDGDDDAVRRSLRRCRGTAGISRSEVDEELND